MPKVTTTTKQHSHRCAITFHEPCNCGVGTPTVMRCGECGEDWPCTQWHRADVPPIFSAAHHSITVEAY